MKDAIEDAAERHARRGGYHGFSFRNLAAEVGIKSASVHYHFSTKGDLVAALAERYMARMRDTLGDASSLSASVAIKRLSEVFVERQRDRRSDVPMWDSGSRGGWSPRTTAAQNHGFLRSDYAVAGNCLTTGREGAKGCRGYRGIGGRTDHRPCQARSEHPARRGQCAIGAHMTSVVPAQPRPSPGLRRLAA